MGDSADACRSQIDESLRITCVDFLQFIQSSGYFSGLQKELTVVKLNEKCTKHQFKPIKNESVFSVYPR